MALKYRFQYILFTIFCFLLADSIALPELIITPSSGNYNVYAGFPTEIPINFTNNGTQTMYNLTFVIATDRNFFRVPVINNISANSTIVSNITIISDGVFNRNYGIKTEFYYVDNESIAAKTYEVNITPSDFQPAFRTINKGDTVQFTNRDSQNHTIIFQGGINSGIILPNTNWSYTFNNEGNFSYYDNLGGLTLTGNVLVQNTFTAQLKHDVALDKYFIMGVNSQYATGEISVNELINNLEVAYTSQGEGAIQIINNRAVPLVNINFQVDSEFSNWITFQSQNFNMSQGQSKVVTYIVTPKPKKTNQTNITHTIPYKVMSSNALEVNRNISVRVPFFDFGTINLNNTVVQITELSVDDTIAFCLARPDYANCQKLILFCLEYPDYGKCRELFRERIVEVPVNYNISGDKIESMVSSTELSGNVWQRMENKYTTIFEDINSMKATNEELKSQYDILLAENKAIKDKEAADKKANTIATIFKVIGLIFLSMFIGLFFLFRFVVIKGMDYKMVRLPPD